MRKIRYKRNFIITTLAGITTAIIWYNTFKPAESYPYILFGSVTGYIALCIFDYLFNEDD